MKFRPPKIIGFSALGEIGGFWVTASDVADRGPIGT